MEDPSAIVAGRSRTEILVHLRNVSMQLYEVGVAREHVGQQFYLTFELRYPFGVCRVDTPEIQTETCRARHRKYSQEGTHHETCGIRSLLRFATGGWYWNLLG